MYVDFRDPSDRQPITTLIKGCRDEHAIETSVQILISKPGRFRNFGENLIRDPGEAYAFHIEVTHEAVDYPTDATSVDKPPPVLIGFPALDLAVAGEAGIPSRLTIGLTNS